MSPIAAKIVITEKSVKMANDNIYMFAVGPTLTKLKLKAFIEDKYGVTVEGVNILVRKGKSKMSYRKGSRPLQGKTKNVKLAYVRIKDGDKITEFEEAIEGMEE